MTPKKVLIVEDEADAASALAAQLTPLGLDVRTAPDGTHAIKDAQQFRPDLILLDLRLPGGDGLSVLKRLRLSTFTDKTPVIVVTAVQDEAYKQKVLAQGVAAYLQKPEAAVAVVPHVRQLLGI